MSLEKKLEESEKNPTGDVWDNQFDRDELTQLLSHTKPKLSNSVDPDKLETSVEKEVQIKEPESLNRIKSQELFGKNK